MTTLSQHRSRSFKTQPPNSIPHLLQHEFHLLKIHLPYNLTSGIPLLHLNHFIKSSNMSPLRNISSIRSCAAPRCARARSFSSTSPHVRPYHELKPIDKFDDYGKVSLPMYYPLEVHTNRDDYSLSRSLSPLTTLMTLER